MVSNQDFTLTSVEQYLRELASTRDRFPTLHDRLASDITHRDLAPLLDVISPGGRNPVMRYLRRLLFRHQARLPHGESDIPLGLRRSKTQGDRDNPFRQG